MTDSISFTKNDMSPFSIQEQKILLKEINALMPEFIIFEDDGLYEACITLRAKNYVLWDGKKKSVKGSAFKTSTKERALAEFMQKIVDSLIISDDIEPIIEIYHDYVKEILNLQDINRWTKKITVTSSVLNAKGHELLTDEEKKEEGIRKNETEVWDAIKYRELNQMGDKLYIFPAILGERDEEQEVWRKHPKTKISEFKGHKTVHIIDKGLSLTDKWNGSNHDVKKLLKRLWDTLKIFQMVIDIEKFIDYNRKENKELMENLK